MQQRRNVITALAQRWNPDVDDVQAVVEILAEIAGADAVREVAVRRGDHARVDAGVRTIGTDALNLSGFEEAEQDNLHARGHLPNFVHEDGAAVSMLEEAAAVAVRAGEAAPLVPDEFVLEQALGHASAIPLDERFSVART